MRLYRFVITALLAVFLASGAVAKFPRGAGVVAGLHGWQTLKIGAGGYVPVIDWPNASAPFLIGTDVGGAYQFSGGQWVQLVTSNSMPAALTGPENWLGGVYDIRSAPGDPTRCYMGYAINNGSANTAHVLKSDNCNSPASITWTDLTAFGTACSACTWNANSQGGVASNYKLSGPKMGVDPFNKDVVIVATPSAGQKYSLDAGVTWSTLPNVTTSAGGMPATGIAFDASGLHNCGAGTNQTCKVWICTYGDGCWRSTTGTSGTFTKQTSGTGPTNVANGKIGIDGTYYVTEVDASTWIKVWRFTTTWTDISPPGSSGNNYTIAVYPSDATKLVVTSQAGAQSFLSSANSGTPTYTGTITGYSTRASADIPWLTASTNTAANSLNLGDTVMDPSVPGKVWASAGLGVWWSTSTSGTSAWNAVSTGIEELVANRITAPPGGTPVGGFWDRPFFNLSPLNSFKTGYGNSYAASNDISMGWGVDYCTSAPTTIVGLNNWADNLSGYSTTNASPNSPSSWTLYANFPNLVGTYIGGGIACSTPDNVMFAAANNGDIYYSKNATSGAAVWTKVLASAFGHGMQQGNGSVQPGWGISYSVPHQAVCADRVTTGTFYAYNSQTNALGGGFYRSTDQGDTWTQMKAQFASGSDSGGFVNHLYCVPGKAGHLFYTGGQNLSAMYHSEDGGTTQLPISGAGCTPSSVYDVTTGATKAGNNYPSVYFVGKCGSTFAVWRSDNTAAEWAAGTAITWTNLGLPAGYMDQPTTLAADNDTWNQVYMGSKGTGAQVFYP